MMGNDGHVAWSGVGSHRKEPWSSAVAPPCQWQGVLVYDQAKFLKARW